MQVSTGNVGYGIGTETSSSQFITPERPRLCESIRCDHDAVCELAEDGFPRCTCTFNCTVLPGTPRICASDLKLYNSDCEMRREACHRQTELRPRPMELCEGKTLLVDWVY